MKFWKTETWKDLKLRLASSSTVPIRPLIFRPLIETPLSKTKCVIFNGRAYTQPLNTDGLALSVTRDTDHLPLSTRDLLDEYADDLGVNFPKNASLKRWAQNGVLLWNVVAAHSENVLEYDGVDLAWISLAQEILETAYLNDPNTVFVLWEPLPAVLVNSVLPTDALVIRSPGPGYREFWGSRPFSSINKLRRSVKAEPIDWRLK